MTMRPLVAIDLGATKVACAIGLPHERSPGFELLGSSLVPYPTRSEAWLGDLLLVSRTLEQALEATAIRGDFQRAFVAVDHPSLASEQVVAAVALGDEPVTVRAIDLDRLQRAALDQVLGVDREPLLVERLGCAGNGFEGMRDPRGLPATRLRGAFHIVTIPMAVRRAVVQAVESVGLEVAELRYTLQAALAGVADAEAAQRRVLLIDVGGVATNIGVFVDGILHGSSVVPWGGLKLAIAIATDLQVTLDQAVTWSLEGTACRKPAVRTLLTDHWNALQKPLNAILKAQPRPDAAIVTGRGALIDGFAEWVEGTTGIPTSLGRSSRTSRVGDLSRQLGLSPAIGLLELATRTADGSVPASPHLFNRLIDRTRTLLTDYF